MLVTYPTLIRLSNSAPFAPKTPTRTYSLSTLTDVSLFAILESLPVVDLLTAPCLSKRFGELASLVARHRQALILNDSPWSIAFLTRVFPPTIAHYLALPRGSPRRRLLRDAHPAILRLSASSWKLLLGGKASGRSSLSWQPLATHLPSLLPNISRLYVSVLGDASTLRMLTSLVDLWSPKLTRLHFRYQMLNPINEPSEPEKAAVRLLYTNLLAVFNRLPGTFQHLHLDITPSDAFSLFPGITIDLPILGQLKKVYLRTNTLGNYSQGNQQDALLFRYLAGPLAPKLSPRRRVTFDTSFNLTPFPPMPTCLATCLVSFNLSETIKEGNIAQFSILCGRLGANGGGATLRDLRVSFSLPLGRLVEAMAPLSKLTHLHLGSHHLQAPQMAPPGAGGPPLHQLPSVRSLTLWHFFEGHASLERFTLALGSHFPGVRVAWLLSLGQRCIDCGHMWLQGEEDCFQRVAGFDAQLAAQCSQVGKDYLRRYLPNLQVILSSRRVGWLQYDTSQLTEEYAPWN